MNHHDRDFFGIIRFQHVETLEGLAKVGVQQGECRHRVGSHKWIIQIVGQRGTDVGLEWCWDSCDIDGGLIERVVKLDIADQTLRLTSPGDRFFQSEKRGDRKRQTFWIVLLIR